MYCFGTNLTTSKLCLTITNLSIFCFESYSLDSLLLKIANAEYATWVLPTWGKHRFGTKWTTSNLCLTIIWRFYLCFCFELCIVFISVLYERRLRYKRLICRNEYETRVPHDLVNFGRIANGTNSTASKLCVTTTVFNYFFKTHYLFINFLYRW